MVQDPFLRVCPAIKGMNFAVLTIRINDFWHTVSVRIDHEQAVDILSGGDLPSRGLSVRIEYGDLGPAVRAYYLLHAIAIHVPKRNLGAEAVDVLPFNGSRNTIDDVSLPAIGGGNDFQHRVIIDVTHCD